MGRKSIGFLTFALLALPNNCTYAADPTVVEQFVKDIKQCPRGYYVKKTQEDGQLTVEVMTVNVRSGNSDGCSDDPNFGENVHMGSFYIRDGAQAQAFLKEIGLQTTKPPIERHPANEHASDAIE